VRTAPPAADRAQGDADLRLLAGLGLGAFALGSLALLGTVCPLCAVASPALIGAGLYAKHKARRQQRDSRSKKGSRRWTEPSRAGRYPSASPKARGELE